MTATKSDTPRNLSLCRSHQQEWKQSEYDTKNCDYCELERQLNDTRRLLAEASKDAERWNALLNCKRIRVLGHAGFNKDQIGYRHIGLELWTRHQAETTGNARELITEFADAAIKERS